MKIALISDIHDHIEYLKWALEEILQSDARQILCLGDIVSPFTARYLAQYTLPVFGIFGNNEGDRTRILRVSLKKGSSLVMANTDFSEWEFQGKTYFLSHYPQIAELATCSGKYEAVFHGHTHEKRNEILSGIPIVNPGEIAAVRTGVVSFALFDTDSKTTQFREKKKSDSF